MKNFQQVLKLAFGAYNAGHYPDAEAMCRVLIQIRARDAQALFLLGMALHKMNRNDEAVEFLGHAAELEPQSARIFHGLGCVRYQSGDFPRAVEDFARAIELEPARSDVFYSMGNACYKFGDIERALGLFRKAVELNPRDAQSWNNIGKCLMQLNRIEEAVVAYNRGVEADPDYVMARYGRAVALLTAGRFQEGFRDYEIRWRKMKPRQFSQSRWHGETIAGKILFLHAEQGFGDAIQAVRFISLARKRSGAAKIILECRPELKTLFQFSRAADEVIAFGEAIPPFDFFTSLISLPHALGVSHETIPRDVPYLKALAGKNFPVTTAGHLKIGFAWAGSLAHHDDASRSMQLTDFSPILQTPGVTFYSLQKSVSTADKKLLETLPNVTNLGSHFKDFLETTAAVAEMDLIISVDTSVAHLAGALGKPVWTMIQFVPDWRWSLDRTDTIWYPTMRLFRQKKRNEWSPVVAEVEMELSGLVSTKNA